MKSVSAEQLWIRTDWTGRCEFLDLGQEEVLREVARRTSQVPKAAVVFDLDSTLYEVQPRTERILRDWAGAPESAAFPLVREALSRLELGHVGYSLRDSFRALGLDVEKNPSVTEAWESAKQFWAERFFTSAFLSHDRPYPGAAEFVQEIYRLGADLIYLTGRDSSAMGEGTRANLVRDGFPWDVPRTRLILKPEFEMDDLEHKRQACQIIGREHGTVVASFENEPKNLAALQAFFPEAMHVFVDTVCSDHPAPVCQGLYRIKGFAQK